MNEYFEDDPDEPTFSLYDFKKWLDKQQDGVPGNMQEQHKEESKKQFKKKFKEKIRRRPKKD